MKLNALDVKCLELEAFERGLTYEENSKERWYFDGKGHAFSEIWEILRFGGRAPSPQVYNEEADRDVKEVRRLRGNGEFD